MNSLLKFSLSIPCGSPAPGLQVDSLKCSILGESPTPGLQVDSIIEGHLSDTFILTRQTCAVRGNVIPLLTDARTVSSVCADVGSNSSRDKKIV